MMVVVSRFRGRVHRRQAIRLAVAAVVVVAAGWCLGFGWFLLAIGRPATLPPHADGILALTGGAERVETALRLLADRRADRLLVSGIGPVTDLVTLGRLAGVDTSRLADRVTLGRNAASTHGNAVEAAEWARNTGMTSVIVVTAYYHMPRALAELQPALRGIRLYPFPVGGEVGHRAALRLLVEEYSKYLVALTGVTAWLPAKEIPGRETPRGAAGG